MVNRTAAAACAVVVAALGLGACGGSTGVNGKAAAKDDGIGCPDANGKVVGYSEPVADPNFAAIERIVRDSLKKYGVTLKAANANVNSGKQISDLQSLIQQQVDVLIANPVDPNATRAMFDRARTKKIPIVAQDTKIGGPFYTDVREDMEYAGRDGADQLKKLVGDGKVGAVYGPSFAEILTWEKQAFDAEAKKNGLNVVVRSTNQKLDPGSAKQIAQAWKEKYGKQLAGVWTFNDSSAVGVASSMGAGFSPQLVSINGQPEAIPLVKQGKIDVTYSVPYEKTGQALAYSALSALCGRTIPKELIVPVKRLTRKNADQWRPLAVRAKDPFKIQLEKRDGATYVKVD